MDTLTIRPARADEPGVAAIINAHFALMRATSPEESCHVLPAGALLDEFMLAAERNGQVVGIGALKPIAPDHGEIKSMHTTQAARGHGVARQILRDLVTEAQQRGMTRVSLETGSQAPFAPARNLYATEGFQNCPPFGTYVEDPLSVFMTRALTS